MLQHWKRTLAGCGLLAVLVLSCCAVAWASPSSGTCGKNLSWKLEENTLTISGSGKMVEFFEKDGAPWRHMKDKTERVIIGNGVTSLSYEAFQGFDKLRYVRVGDGVEEIHTGVFDQLPALQEVRLGAGMEKIGTLAFFGCTALHKVEMNAGLESIGRMAFYGCTSLPSAELPDGLRHIGSSAFAGCTALEELPLSGSIHSVGVNAMKDTGWYARQGEGPLYLGRVLLGWKGQVPAAVQVKDGTRIIGDGAFLMEEGLREVTLPDSLRRIGESAFASCTNLRAVDLGEGVTHIGKYAFDHCTALKGLSMPDSVTFAGNGAFSASGLEGIRISGQLETLSSRVFSRCENLQAISIPRSVYRLGDEVFFGCTALSDVTFRGSAPYIASDSFCDVTARVYYPDGWSSAERKNYGGDLHWIGVSSRLEAPELTLAIEPESGKPRLRWSAVAGAESYQVYRRVGRDGSYTRLGSTQGTTLRNSSAVPGTAYFYQVRAVDGGTVGAFSQIKNMTCDCAQPVVRTAFREDGKPVLHWKEVEGAERYDVRRSVDGGEMEHLYTAKGTSLVHSSAQGGSAYRYQVRALCENPNGNSVWSQAVEVYCPAVPGTPAVELDFDEDTGLPQLSWGALQDAQRYEIWRSADGGEAELVEITEENSFCDEAAVVGHAYGYQVRAVNDFFAGPMSEALTLQFGLEAPVLEVNLREDGKPVLQWSAVGGAERYEILFSTSGEEGSFEHLFSTSGTRLNHSSAVPGVTYYYQVYGFAGEMIGPESEVVPALCPALVAPEVKTRARAGTGKPQLSWTAVPGAEGYEVWCSENGQPEELLHTARGTTLNHNSALAGEKYAYQVRAITADQQGPFSARKVRTCDCSAPQVRVALRDGRPLIQWAAVDAATGYQVWVSEDGGSYRLLYTARGTQLRHSSAARGHGYSYKVRALCRSELGNSAYSEPVSIRVK